MRSTTLLTTLFTFFTLSAFASVRVGELDKKFFANPEFIDDFPGATVLHPNLSQFLAHTLSRTFREAAALVSAVKQNPALHRALQEFPSLESAKKIELMKTLFQIQVAFSGRKAPELLLDNDAKRSTFFEFDINRPTAGKVILNPQKLFSDENRYAALLFLIHETRHSSQFQEAFDATLAEKTQALAYLSAFHAQQEVFEKKLKVSFCDFLTLNQEYEAFLFGNLVMEMLTDGKVDTSDMGTLASQYEPGHGLKLDLYALLQKVGPEALLDSFNEREKAQYQPSKR